MSIAIKVENLSKIYQIGEIGTGTLSRDLERWWTTKILGKEDPFLKIGQTNDRSKKGESDVVYSLQDINFEIEQGDAVGIIGKNGVGKSTLLKILSRITSPTTGKIQVKGRVASLLEVGTGFHPELTGRDNIYLNGAILGMRKREITRKLDEIIEFSGVERYIDTPVKRYSSGMYVRLAFAVAAHLESEILIVDEVLAVGDAEFQKKCLGKMGEVSKGEGRTVLFVSHNMKSIRNLCLNCILLEKGKVFFEGETKKALSVYLSDNKKIGSLNVNLVDHPNNKVKNNLLTHFSIETEGRIIYSQSKIKFNINHYFNKEIKNPQFCILLYNYEDILIFSFISNYQPNNVPKSLIGKGKINCKVENLNIMPGNYYITLKLWVPGEKLYEIEQAANFSVDKSNLVSNFDDKYDSSLGIVYFPSFWSL